MRPRERLGKSPWGMLLWSLAVALTVASVTILSDALRRHAREG